uniref:Uncharacterized protein n=1 Tax=Anguilla anguilla TaxID=7936 RepID=A0A0E9QBX2_ANGAN
MLLLHYSEKYDLSCESQICRRAGIYSRRGKTLLS